MEVAYAKEYDEGMIKFPSKVMPLDIVSFKGL